MDSSATSVQTPKGDLVAQIPEIFRSVGDLVAAGGNGLAAIILVCVMIVIVASLLFGSRMTADMVRLTKWYLVTGAVCVAMSLAVSVVDRFFGATYDLHIAVSPALDSKGYPVPVIRADTVVVPLQTKFAVNHSMDIQISMDATLDYLENLANAKLVAEQTTATCAATVNEQNIQLAAAKSSLETFKTSLSGNLVLPNWASTQFTDIGSKLTVKPAIDWTKILDKNNSFIVNNGETTTAPSILPDATDKPLPG